MNKLLLTTFLLGLVVFSAGSVMGDQTVIVNGDEVIDFTLTNLDFGSITPGTLGTADSTMTLGIPNNVDFDLEIYLDDGSDSLFDLIIMDLSNIGGSDIADLGIGQINAVTASVDDADVDDISTEQIFDIFGDMDVPVGILPGERTATIVYTVTGTTP